MPINETRTELQIDSQTIKQSQLLVAFSVAKNFCSGVALILILEGGRPRQSNSRKKSLGGGGNVRKGKRPRLTSPGGSAAVSWWGLRSLTIKTNRRPSQKSYSTCDRRRPGCSVASRPGNCPTHPLLNFGLWENCQGIFFLSQNFRPKYQKNGTEPSPILRKLRVKIKTLSTHNFFSSEICNAF